MIRDFGMKICLEDEEENVDDEDAEWKELGFIGGNVVKVNRIINEGRDFR